MKKQSRQTTTRRYSRRGFTLVELMVSVTLVLMIMVMFASVYRMATDTVSTQKGIRRNDQRARMLSTIIRSDLENRSFLDVIPFTPGQDTENGTAGPSYVPSRRRGYFAISENDPNNGLDDVLALTVVIPDDGSMKMFTGRSVMIVTQQGATAAGLPWPAPATEPQRSQWYTQYLAAHPNQPEFDDGNPDPNNGTGASRAVEVVYFVRNGNLYRRELLIRDSYADPDNPQPSEVTGDYGTVTGGNVSGFFWEDFAYAAFYKNVGTSQGCKFHSVQESLQNRSGGTITDLGWPVSLGIPHLRFGHSLGRGHVPREYIGTGASQKFIGRFLTQETASQNFRYPGRMDVPDPHTRALTDANNDGIIDEFNDNPSRRGEHLLMTNVHEFDIKVWDNLRGAFVDLGNSGSGHYSQSAKQRGVGDSTWNRYDTWHPYNSSSLGVPPFRPINNPGRLGYENEEIPLRAIQITIRFYDVSTDKMRQVTILQSLVD